MKLCVIKLLFGEERIRDFMKKKYFIFFVVIMCMAGCRSTGTARSGDVPYRHLPMVKEEDILPEKSLEERSEFKFQTIDVVAPEKLNFHQNTIIYIVKKGETLYGIAQRHQVALKEITEMNHIEDASKIYAGQALKIPPNQNKAISHE